MSAEPLEPQDLAPSATTGSGANPSPSDASDTQDSPQPVLATRVAPEPWKEQHRVPKPIAQRLEKTGQQSPLLQRRLTNTELRVLKVLMNPAYVDLDEQAKLALCGCGATKYRKVKRDPAVRAEMQRMINDALDEEIAPILKKSAEVAKNMGRDGFQDRKMLLTMQGAFKEGGGGINVHLGGAKKMVIGVVGIDPDDV
jgi:hypothetical protein